MCRAAEAGTTLDLVLLPGAWRNAFKRVTDRSPAIIAHYGPDGGWPWPSDGSGGGNEHPFQVTRRRLQSPARTRRVRYDEVNSATNRIFVIWAGRFERPGRHGLERSHSD